MKNFRLIGLMSIFIFLLLGCSLGSTNENNHIVEFKPDMFSSHFGIDKGGFYYQDFGANIKNYYPNFSEDEVSIVDQNFFIYQQSLYSNYKILEGLYDNSITKVSDNVSKKGLKRLGDGYLYDKENIYTIYSSEYGYPNVLKKGKDSLDLENKMLIQNNIMYCFSDDNYFNINFENFPIVQEYNDIRLLKNKSINILYLYIGCKRFVLMQVSPNTDYKSSTDILKDVNIQTLELIGEHYIKVGKDIYINEKYKLYGDLIHDFDTFQHIEGNIYRDKDYFYYILRPLYGLEKDKVQILESNIVTDGQSGYYKIWKVKNPNIVIKELGRSYFKNNDKIYTKSFYGGEEVEVDSTGFEIIGDGAIKDNLVVYYGGNNLDLNPTTFKNYNWGYFGDDENIFFGPNKIVDVDTQTFETFLLAKDIARDKGNVYYGSKKLNSVDAETFEVLNYYFAMDKNNLYFLGGRIEKIHGLNQENDDVVVLGSNSVMYQDRKYIAEIGRTLMVNGMYQSTDAIK